MSSDRTPSARPSYDVAAYIWPSYHDDPRSRVFWPGRFGEWETVMAAKPRFPGHLQPKRPLWGYQNEADPRVMEMQIDAAADHGVNVFIYDWYWYDRGPFLEACLNEGFLGARNHHRMKFYLMWANHDANTLWDTRTCTTDTVWRGDCDPAEFERVGRHLIERYFRHPAYYRIGGKPVFCIYQLTTFLAGFPSVAKAAGALTWLREECVRAGLPGLHLQGTLRRASGGNATGVNGDGTEASRNLIRDLGLDSVTLYQWVHMASPTGKYLDWGRRAWDAFEQLADLPGIDVFPHVSIGWDNNPRYPEQVATVTGRSPEAFRDFLVEARAHLDSRPGLQAPLVTINSWNEWTEDSYLLPDRDFGYAYLEAVKGVFGTATRSPSSAFQLAPP